MLGRARRVPQHPPFLASRPTPSGGALLLGLPSDAGASFRKGAARGPAAIRALSDSVESYSLLARRDLEEVGLWDAGDLALPVAGPGEVLPAAEAGVREALIEDPGSLAVLLGGDHSLSLAGARALASLHPDLGVLVLDAHLDLREEYGGERFSHACTVRRLAEAFHTFLVGYRSASREEALSLEAGSLPPGFLGASRRLELPEAARKALADRPLYVSLDLDILDPSEAPGVGNPEPGGPSFLELLEFLLGLARFRVVCLDVMETSPELDPSGRTALAAAVLVREAVLAFTSARSGES